LIKEQLYGSVGGRFIESLDTSAKQKPNIPYPIQTGRELLDYTKAHNCKISDIVFRNELSIRSQEDIAQRYMK